MQDLEKGEWLNNDSASNHSFYLFFKKKKLKTNYN